MLLDNGLNFGWMLVISYVNALGKWVPDLSNCSPNYPTTVFSKYEHIRLKLIICLFTLKLTPVAACKGITFLVQ